MKRLVYVFIAIVVTSTSFAVQIPNQLGLDWRTDGPFGKNWIKLTEHHYLDKMSIRKVSSSIYQARLCIDVKLPRGGVVWNYFNVRVDCKDKQAYAFSQSSNKWIGPLSPADYDEAVLKYACK